MGVSHSEQALSVDMDLSDSECLQSFSLRTFLLASV